MCDKVQEKNVEYAKKSQLNAAKVQPKNQMSILRKTEQNATSQALTD